MEYKRLDGETDNQLIYRICEQKDVIGTWNDVSKILNELTGNDFSQDAYRKKYQSCKNMIDCFNDSNLSKIQRDLEIERKKLQTEKIEYNKWLREQARDELIVEKIEQAIEKLEPIEPFTRKLEDSRIEQQYLLCFGDAHYGIEFKVDGLFDDEINSYSPEIFKKRMNILLSKVLDIVEKEKITTLNVWDLGDNIQGILRLNSQLMKLKYGIIDSAIQYSEYLANWLNTLSKFVRIKFQLVMDSNHNQIRICNAPKNAFPEENVSKVILTYLKIRLKDNENITFIENPTGMNYSNICGYIVIGIHGEQKDMGKTINDFQRLYGACDYLIGGHKHHSVNEEIGQNCEAISIRSIIGVDPYGASLNRGSDAGASLFVFKRLEGINCEYKIKL